MLRSFFSTPFFASLALLPAGLAGPALADTAANLSGPYVHKGLAVYFIHGKSAPGPAPLTLKEALDAGTAKVHETGNVGELEIENLGDKDLLVHAGDIVKGGKQDRVLAVSLIVPPKSGRTPVSSYCVEQGRWAARGSEDVKTFASAERMMPSRKAKLAIRAAAAPRPVETETTTAEESHAGLSRDSRIVQQRQTNLGGYSAQGEVWESVGSIQAALSANVGEEVKASKSESSLQLALENEKLAKAKKDYIDALSAKADAAQDIVGYAFAINGKLNSAEIYSSNALFKKLWPRLLDASATEALSSENETDTSPAPKLAAVQEFITQRSSDKAEEKPLNTATKVRQRESAIAYDVETVSPAGAVLHRSLVAK